MKEVLIKSLGFIIIMALGYILKKRGFFKKEDGLFLSKIVMNITLPAALIAGASSNFNPSDFRSTPGGNRIFHIQALH